MNGQEALVWWLTALWHVLWQDLQPFSYLALGAAAGATLGSLWRWYASRWLLGFVVGFGSGLLLFTLLNWNSGRSHELHNWVVVQTLRYFRPAGLLFNGNFSTFVSLLLLLQAAIGSCLTSVALSHSIHHSTSARVIAFRQRPMAWGTTRIALYLFAVVVVFGSWVWYATHRTQIEWRKNVLLCDFELPRLKQQLEPFGVSIKYDGRATLLIELEALPELSDAALQEFAETRCPIEIYLLSQRIQDSDLTRLVGRIPTAKFIYLRCSQVTDAGLMALTVCPRVNQMSIIDCELVTRAGIDRFHAVRPEIRINADNGTDVVKY